MRATIDGPATGSTTYRPGENTGPPPCGDAILPHEPGGNSRVMGWGAGGRKSSAGSDEELDAACGEECGSG